MLVDLEVVAEHTCIGNVFCELRRTALHSHTVEVDMANVHKHDSTLQMNTERKYVISACVALTAVNLLLCYLTSASTS